MGPLSFEWPVGLALLALIAPLVLLYVLKTKRPRVTVASTWLWRAAARDATARSPWKKLRAEASLLLEALALIALAVALARPIARTTVGSRHTYALVMDVSASMAARSGDSGGSRLDAAKDAAHKWMRSLPRGARVLVVEAGRDARLVSGFETDGHRLDSAIDSLAALDVEGNLDAGVALAADRLSTMDGAEVVVVTDGNVAHPPTFDGVRVPVDVLTVGDPIDNLAIIRVTASTETDPFTHKDMTRVFAVVANFGGAPREVYATLRRGDAGGKDASTSALIASRRLVVAPGERAPLVLSFAPETNDIGTGLILDVSPHDAFPTDDVAFVRVPEGPRLRVVLATKDGEPSPWLERALGSDRNVDLIRVNAAELRDTESSRTPGLVVVDGVCPLGSFAEDFVIVHPPLGDCRGERVVAGLEHPSVTSWATGDPRLRFLSLDGIEIARSNALLVEDPGAKLLRAGEQTLMADVSDAGRIGTLIAFDVGETNWPLRASFVVFVRNVLEQARSDHDRGAVSSSRTGEPIRLEVTPGLPGLNVTAPSGESFFVHADGGVAFIPPVNHPGIYRARFEGRLGEIVVPVNLTSAAESDLASKLVVPIRGDVTVRSANDARLVSRDVGYVFVAAALLFMMLDVWIVTRGASVARRPVLVGALVIALGSTGYALLLGFGWVRETFLRLERPWVVAILPLAMLLVASRLSAKARAIRRGARVIAEDLVASLLTFALVLGIAGPSIGRELRRLTVIVAVDRSRSVDLVPDAAERLSAELKRAESSMRADDRIGTVVFGATAATEEPPHRKEEKPTAQRVEVARDTTDIDRALRRALSDVPSDSAARIVLLSDGVGNRGDTMSGAAATLAAEVPVDTVALEQREVPDIRVVSMLGPTRGNAGEAIDFRVVTQATQTTPVELRVLLDGAVVSKSPATLARGEDVLRLREKLPGPGLHHYEVEIAANEPALDFSVDDNAGNAFVRVRGDAQALVLEGDAGKGAFVVSALRAAGFQADERGIGGAPPDLGGFARYDLVVLSDIPAASFGGAQIDALASFVRDFGGGLWLMGGDRSLGPGGYGKSAIEEISPLSFDLKKKVRRACLAEVIGIDISGSMGMVVDGRTKLDLANEAAARSAALLGDMDHLGVEHVDTEVHWSVPLGPIVDRAGIDRAIRGVSVGGGGIIVPITMEAGYAALDKETTSLKHMLLFADGDDAEEIKAAMPSTPAAKARGITTSTVALGSGKDVGDLQEMARLGGGRFYLVEDASRLPSVFAEETILASRAAISEEPFHVAPGAVSPATLGLDFGGAPALKGYVVTIPKERATTSLLGPDGDPILASWQVGVGKCGVFTSDLKDRWGVDWTSWPPAARLVAQMARDLQRRADDERVSLEADTTGGDLHIRATAAFEDRSADSFRRLTVHVGGPDGFARDVDLDPIGTGAYAATVPLTRPGTYIAVAKDEAAGVVVSSTGAVLGPGEELRPTGTDHAMLGRIAKLTGGKVRASLEGIFDDRPRTRFAYEDATQALIVAAAALVLGVVASRRLSIPMPQLKRSVVADSPASVEGVAGTARAPSADAPSDTVVAEAPTSPASSAPASAVKTSSADASTAEHLAAKRRKRRERR